MLRTSILFASALTLTALSGAQSSPIPTDAEKVVGPVKNAGVYHVATGTWTRTGAQVANFGPDVIYSNRAWSGYFSTTGGAGGTLPLSENFDEGQIPSSSNTQNPGGRDEYNVNCFQIAYCDFGPAGGSGWEINFFTQYTPCSFNGAPDASFLTTNLPATGCWEVSFDLTGGEEFCLGADGGDGWDDDLDLDSFGWSYTYSGVDTSSVAGFLIRGDPQNTDPTWVAGADVTDGTDTFFGPPSLCASGGTGLGAQDFWWVESPTQPMSTGCYFFFGYLNNNACQGPLSNMYASFHMELQADLQSCNSTGLGTEYCLSNPNSTGVNTTLTMAGSLVPADNDIELIATLPTNTFGFFITSQTQGFVANPGGSFGNICLSGTLGRFVGPGQVKNSGAMGQITLNTNLGEWDLAAIPTAVGPYAAMAGIQSNFQLWHRDSVMGVASSNFSNGRSVVWE